MPEKNKRCFDTKNTVTFENVTVFLCVDDVKLHSKSEPASVSFHFK